MEEVSGFAMWFFFSVVSVCLSVLGYQLMKMLLEKERRNKNTEIDVLNDRIGKLENKLVTEVSKLEEKIDKNYKKDKLTELKWLYEKSKRKKKVETEILNYLKTIDD